MLPPVALEVNPVMQEYFHMCACSVKWQLQDTLPEEKEITNTELFRDAIRARIEFYEYYDWLKNRLSPYIPPPPAPTPLPRKKPWWKFRLN